MTKKNMKHKFLSSSIIRFFPVLTFFVLLATLPSSQSSKSTQKVTKQKKSKGMLIDKILVRVNIEGFKGVNILQSDLEKPRIEKEGGTYTLDEAIMEELMLQKATEKH